MFPNKTDVLDYLDNAGPAPDRYAHVLLDHRACVDPYYEDILVGPIGPTGIKNGTTHWEPLEYPITRKTAGRVRNLDADADDTLYSQWIYKISANISDITLDLWKGTALGLDNDTLAIWGIDPLWQDDGRIIRWDAFWHNSVSNFDTQTLLPLGLYFRSDVTGRDPSQWRLEGWYYNGIFYDTTEAFRNAYYTPGFVKLGANSEGVWATTDQNGPVLPFDTASPPASVAPSGARYSVDAESKWVQWMDFSFYVGYQRDTGLSLWDIRYKGERVLYELGLQEALAHYAGQDPLQSGTSYLDTYYGFGPYAFELVKGYDCPAYATYLNTSFYVSETTHTHLNSLCLFEFTADYPLQRHSTSDYVSATKNTYFTIRSVSTVGNYDYMFSYSFYLGKSPVA
jgi:primary-amine oxidase